jgi:hypothetical protein
MGQFEASLCPCLDLAGAGASIKTGLPMPPLRRRFACSSGLGDRADVNVVTIKLASNQGSSDQDGGLFA